MNPIQLANTSAAYQGAISSLDPNATVYDDFSVLGSSPENALAKNGTPKEYMILGISPDDFLEKHGSPSFDFENLKFEFNKICKDFLSELQMELPSKAVEFSSKIIYEVGPESRRVKTEDKTWKFKFIYKESTSDIIISEDTASIPAPGSSTSRQRTSKIVVTTAFVSTYRHSQFIPKATNSYIMLTVKQASLLAMVTLEKINEIGYSKQPPILLLTPLAGAVFHKDDLGKIADRFTDQNAYSVCNTINASSQSSGQYLPNSELSFALVSIIAATSRINQALRKSLIAKTAKQYLSKDKQFDPTIFSVAATFATGGVPDYLAPNKLIALFKETQEAIKPRLLVRESFKTEMGTRGTFGSPSDQQDEDEI